jgi:hypothetical protein
MSLMALFFSSIDIPAHASSPTAAFARCTTMRAQLSSHTVARRHPPKVSTQYGIAWGIT